MEPLNLQSKLEESFLLSLVKQSPYLEEYSYWSIGGIRLKSSRNAWAWIPSNKKIDYDIEWAHGEPNNFNGLEKCLGLKVHPQRTGVNDMRCDDDDFGQYGYFCQIVDISDSKRRKELEQFYYSRYNNFVHK